MCRRILCVILGLHATSLGCIVYCMDVDGDEVEVDKKVDNSTTVTTTIAML